MRFEGEKLEATVLGQRIRQAREVLRMSQEELALLVAKDQRAISEYENGKRKLAAIDLPDFAEVLQVPLTYFYEGASPTPDLDGTVLSEFHRLPTLQARQTAIDILRALSSLFD